MHIIFIAAGQLANLEAALAFHPPSSNRAIILRAGQAQITRLSLVQYRNIPRYDMI
jgi:hypothetical protein